MHLLFMSFPLYEYFSARGPSPYCILDFSLTLWTICLVLGSSKAVKNYVSQRNLEKFDAEAGGFQGGADALCHVDKEAKTGDPGWLLRFDSPMLWPFKALYWLTLCYVHAFIIMLMCGCIAYTLYVIYGHSITKSSPLFLPRNPNFPAIFSMRWLFASLGEAFNWNHLTIFFTAFVALVMMGYIFLKVEVTPDNAGYSSPEHSAIRETNRNRMLYLFTVINACIDACYTVLGFYFYALPEPGLPKDVIGAQGPLPYKI